MPLNIRPIAVSFAVICFFGISIAACLSGLNPFTCCKRAITGAILAYIASALAVAAINAILVSAMVENEMKNEKGQSSGDQD